MKPKEVYPEGVVGDEDSDEEEYEDEDEDEDLGCSEMIDEGNESKYGPDSSSVSTSNQRSASSAWSEIAKRATACVQAEDRSAVKPKSASSAASRALAEEAKVVNLLCKLPPPVDGWEGSWVPAHKVHEFYTNQALFYCKFHARHWSQKGCTRQSKGECKECLEAQYESEESPRVFWVPIYWKMRQ